MIPRIKCRLLIIVVLLLAIVAVTFLLAKTLYLKHSVLNIVGLTRPLWQTKPKSEQFEGEGIYNL
jgi:hypothetical protein